MVIGFTLIVFALLSYANSNRLLKQVNVLANQNKVLSQQNKVLNEATSKTGDATKNVVLQNRQYIQCLSNIFANYTHNFVPITIEDLNTCTIKTDGTSGASSANTSNSASSPSKTPTSSHASASGQATSQGSSRSSSANSNTSGSTTQPNLLQRAMTFIKGLL